MKQEESPMRATARNGLTTKPNRAPAEPSLAQLEAGARRFLFGDRTVATGPAGNT